MTSSADRLEGTPTLNEHFPGQETDNLLEILGPYLRKDIGRMGEITLHGFVSRQNFEPPEAKRTALDLARRYDGLSLGVKLIVMDEAIRLLGW